MSTTTHRLATVGELCRLLHTATGMYPLSLVFVGNHAAFRATVGPHQPAAITFRSPIDAEQHISVFLCSAEPCVMMPLPGLWATWEGTVSRMRLNTIQDVAIADLVRQLLATPAESGERAQCLICDIPLVQGRVGSHLRDAHEVEAIRFVGECDGVREYNDTDGRAVLWRWGGRDV